jgi:flagellar hook-associated protein 1 FlgK
LSASPQDDAARQEVISLAGKVASAFHGATNQARNAQLDADQDIQGISKEATKLAQEIAAANKAMVANADPVLADKRDMAAKKLAELTGATARIDPDGQMRVTLEGKMFVDGSRAASLTAAPDPALGGLSTLKLVDGAHQVAVQPGGGKLGGLLHFRDETVTSLQTSIDQLAFDLTTQVNNVHAANAGLDGVSGRPLFTQPTSATGAAKTFSVSAGVLADHRQLATAAVGAGPGSNAGANALAALSGQKLAAGGASTFFDESLRAFGAVGETVNAAQGELEVAAATSDILSAARDSLSGVSVEDEMNQLTILQHASAASLKFIGTVNEMMDDLLRSL